MLQLLGIELKVTGFSRPRLRIFFAVGVVADLLGVAESSAAVELLAANDAVGEFHFHFHKERVRMRDDD